MLNLEIFIVFWKFSSVSQFVSHILFGILNNLYSTQGIYKWTLLNIFILKKNLKIFFFSSLCNTLIFDQTLIFNLSKMNKKIKEKKIQKKFVILKYVTSSVKITQYSLYIFKLFHKFKYEVPITNFSTENNDYLYTRNRSNSKYWCITTPQFLKLILKKKNSSGYTKTYAVS